MYVKEISQVLTLKMPRRTDTQENVSSTTTLWSALYRATARWRWVGVKNLAVARSEGRTKKKNRPKRTVIRPSIMKLKKDLYC